MTPRTPLVVTLAGAALLMGLGAGCGPVPAKDVGEQLFNDARLADSEVNKFSCATCHAMGDPGDRVFAGYDLKNAARRTRFWGGYSTNLLDATNACFTFFMRGTAFTRDDPRARAIYEYLSSAADAPGGDAGEDTLPLTIVENVVSLPKGDASHGADIWDHACAVCHGAPHTGEGRLTELAVLVPEASESFAKEIGFPADLVVIEKIRHGAFFGIGGSMPPFTKEQLSDDDVADLITFLNP